MELKTERRQSASAGARSPKAMKVIIGTEPWQFTDGVYWGDMWTGQALYEAGIYCHHDIWFGFLNRIGNTSLAARS
jgi:hypothetical protein